MKSDSRKGFSSDASGADRIADSKIRAGIVGAGLMGQWHAHALEKAGGTVVGIFDQDRGRADRLAEEYPGSKSYDDLEEMLSDGKPDVLHICTPTAAHEESATAAIRAGVHLLIEKPIVATASATAKLFKLAEAGGTHICPVHQFAFQSGVEKAKKRLPQIGRVIHFEAVIHSAGGAGNEPGVLDLIAGDILPHPLSLAQIFLDGGISGIAWNVLHPASGELLAYGQCSNGSSVSIRISMNARPTRNSLSIIGTGGTIDLNLFHGYAVFELGGTSRTRKLLHPFESGLRNISAAMVNLAGRSVRREPAYPGLRPLIHKFYRSIKFGEEQPFAPHEVIEVAEIRDLIIAKAGFAKPDGGEIQ